MQNYLAKLDNGYYVVIQAQPNLKTDDKVGHYTIVQNHLQICIDGFHYPVTRGK